MQKSIIATLAILLFIQYNSKAVTRIDSIGVENYNGKKLIVHKVESKETYYSISRKYNTNLTETIKFNNNAPLKIGMIIKVPTQNNFNEAEKVVATDKKNTATTNETKQFINYTVEKKDYLFSIAKKFGTSVEKIKQDNNLKTINLKLGQVLKIEPQVNTENIVETVTQSDTLAKEETKKNNQDLIPTKETKNNTDSVTYLANKKLRKIGRKYGLSESEEKGIAICMNDSDLSADKMFVLHRSLPIGTIIKITNPITSTSTFVKVVGKFTENETNKDAIVIITKAVADALNVQEKRFFCHLTYAIIKNE